MELTVDMPWEKDLSVRHCNMGPRGNWHLRRHVEAWIERLAWEVKAAHIEETRELPAYGIQFPVKVVVDMRFPDKRRRDDHNLHYCIANGVAAGLGIDDRHIRISTGTVEIDRERPGFSITVEDRQ